MHHIFTAAHILLCWELTLGHSLRLLHLLRLLTPIPGSRCQDLVLQVIKPRVLPGLAEARRSAHSRWRQGVSLGSGAGPSILSTLLRAVEPLQTRALVPRRSRDKWSGSVLWFCQNWGPNENSAPTPAMSPPLQLQGSRCEGLGGISFPRAIVLSPNEKTPEKFRKQRQTKLFVSSLCGCGPSQLTHPVEQPLTPKDDTVYWTD